MKRPFLWAHLGSIPSDRKITGGEEGVTKSANEENNHRVVDICRDAN
ncbi:MAG TPA: hypothetical protein VF172_13745 [Nitrososphaera sp.]